MTPLEEIIRRRIRIEGPMTAHEYMSLCLAHPEHGYYRSRDPLGRSGDFVTAPEVSQMFGELLGLWAAQVWVDMGAPEAVRLVELGPGRGTLMADALRAARAVPAFDAALDLWLVETSAPLRSAQGEALKTRSARWAERLSEVPDGPVILLANEFFDALPVRQFVKTEGGWRERMVALGEGEALVWGLGPPIPGPAGAASDRPVGAVAEVSPSGRAIAGEIGARLAADGGAALLIDYGYPAPTPGGADTIQAMRDHAYADVLDAPGEADLTAHVDFSALAAAAQGAGAVAWPLISQGALLAALGVEARAAALSAAGPERAAGIMGDLRRLTRPEQMGSLFKALALTAPGAPPPPGFEDAT